MQILGPIPTVSGVVPSNLHFNKPSRCFPCSSVGKEFACNAGDLGSIPGLEHPLEKEMATHSSILAWRISWTKEPNRLQSMGLQELDTTH